MLKPQMPLPQRLLNMRPATLLVLSFLAVIGTGTVLLLLPFSTRGGTIPFVDALFTAASAVCVTGLTVVDPGTYFTGFGQGVILLLIQIGGLGLMTISVALFRLIGRSIPFRHRMVMQDVFAHTPRDDIMKIVKHVVLFTALTELAGAVLLLLRWRGDFSFLRAVYLSVFHSVSAFCNAGFSLFSDNLMGYSGDFVVNFAICGLIVVGGIGFPVLHDVYLVLRGRKGKRGRLAVQTKTVLVTTGCLIVGGAIVIALLERQSLAADSSAAHRFWTPIFQSITCRTAGFNTIDIGALGDATLALMILLMFIGASPGSTGGGIKTTTFVLVSAFTFSRMMRRLRVNLFKRSVPDETVARGVALVLLSLAVIAIVVFMLLIGEAGDGKNDPNAHRPLLSALFETVSAFGTVGLSMGITAGLTAWSKIWIIAMMIIGRVGILTFSYIIVSSSAPKGVEYAEESVMVG